MSKYTEQIERLSAHPEEIEQAWIEGIGLFEFAGTRDKDDQRFGSGKESDLPVGCLTMIAAHLGYVAATPALTKAIKADKRIPKHWSKIGPENFHVFEEWQLRLDKEVRNES